jgi:hypothetical protein
MRVVKSKEQVVKNGPTGGMCCSYVVIATLNSSLRFFWADSFFTLETSSPEEGRVVVMVILDVLRKEEKLRLVPSWYHNTV